jgi:hypothetical protein
MRNWLMTRTSFKLLLVAVLAAVPAVHAQVYKWVDDKGVVNYSSAPPSKGKGVVKLEEDNGRVSTIPALARRDDPAAAADPALRQRVDQLEREAAAQRQSAAQQEIAAAEAYRRWVEQCRAERRVDCDDPNRGAFNDYGAPIYVPPVYARPRPRPVPAPGTYRPTPYVAQGGGGAVGPYYRPPPGGVAIGPGPYGIGAGYVPAPPGGVVIAPGPGGAGARYVPVPESAAPPPRPVRPHPLPAQQ